LMSFAILVSLSRAMILVPSLQHHRYVHRYIRRMLHRGAIRCCCPWLDPRKTLDFCGSVQLTPAPSDKTAELDIH